MKYVKTYLRFRLLMVRHGLRLHGKELWGYVGFLGFFLFVSTSLFLLLLKVFRFFRSFEIVGDLVIMKLLATIFFVFFIFLVLSNINSIVKWFFTKEDLPFVLTNPVSDGAFFVTRSLEALFESSWAFLFFAVPVLLAYYGAVERLTAGAALSFLLLIPFVLIPHGIAFLLVILLSRFLSPRIIKNTFTVLSLLLMGLLITIFRAIQIERLTRPESFAQLYEYMRFLALPSHPFIPTNPFLEAVTYPIKRGSPALLAADLGFFLSTAALVLVLSYWCHHFFYVQCYTNVRAASGRVRHDVLKRLFAFLPLRTKNFFLKDLKNIQRDPKEWSQVFLILALIVVYVYNFKLFPRDRSPLPTIFLESVLAFLNMGLLTFVIAAISVRFVYPAFQLEGRPFWFILSAPVTPREMCRKKLGLFIPPVLVLALILNYLSNRYMSPPPFLFYLSFGYILLVSFVSPLAALYLGTRKIDFHETPNPYGGMGGITAMLAMLSYAAVSLGLMAWSSSSLLFFVQRKIMVPFSVQMRAAAVYLLIAAGSLLLMRFLFRGTIRNLENIEL